MTGGLGTSWEIGPRVVTGLLGKNKGPVIKQLVVKVLTPKVRR